MSFYSLEQMRLQRHEPYGSWLAMTPSYVIASAASCSAHAKQSPSLSYPQTVYDKGEGL